MFVQHEPFQLSLLRQQSQLAQLHHRKDGEKDAAKAIRREQDCGEIQANGGKPDQFCCCKFFIGGQSDCVEKPADTQSFKSTGWIIRRLDARTNQNSNPDASSSSQGWQKDAQLFISTGKPVATGKDQKSLNRQEESVISTGKLVATEDSGPQGLIWPHHIRTSPD